MHKRFRSSDEGFVGVSHNYFMGLLGRAGILAAGDCSDN